MNAFYCTTKQIVLLNAITIVGTHFLIYFKFDDSVSIVKEASLVKESDSTLEVGQICQVKEKKKIHEGQIITYGKAVCHHV